MKHIVISLGVLACVALLVGTSAGQEWKIQTADDDAEFGPWSSAVNLGPIVNSDASEAGPEISRDGLSLYFHSARGAEAANPDLYVSHRAAIDLPWETPVNLGPIVNSASADAGPRLSRDGRLMFFASFRSGNFDVYVSRRRNLHDDLAWETPLALPAPINGASFDVPLGYFEDSRGGAQLYFGSDRANGGGALGNDIYLSELRRDGTWSEPVYVSELNSAFQEGRVAIRADGLEVIFDSAREGNLDLYVSRRKHVWEPWSTPENLGPVVNSLAGDIHPALSANGRTLYFASSRGGNFDLYACTRTKVHRH